MITPPLTVFVPLVSSSAHRAFSSGVNLCAAVVSLSVSFRLPPLSTLITLPPLLVIFSTQPFRSSVTVLLTARLAEISMFVPSRTVSAVPSKASVSSCEDVTSLTVPVSSAAAIPSGSVRHRLSARMTLSSFLLRIASSFFHGRAFRPWVS